MRHNKKFNHLGRTASHRASMLANMAISLIMHKRITTTVAKAKALKKYVRRVVFSYLQNKEVIKELFSTVSEKVGDRPGGYTRIIKLGTRQGDAAQICFIELVDFDPEMAKTETKKKATRRSRKSTKAEAPAQEAPKAEEAPATEAAAEEAAEAPAAEEAAKAE